jgi:hypothetical protein
MEPVAIFEEFDLMILIERVPVISSLLVQLFYLRVKEILKRYTEQQEKDQQKRLEERIQKSLSI